MRHGSPESGTQHIGTGAEFPDPTAEGGARCGTSDEPGIGDEDGAGCPTGPQAEDDAGIEDVDWGALRHAYGSAEDVPALLRAAGGAGGAAEREEAFDELGSALCHQGSVYSATVAAVPFLARLAQAPGTATRDRLRSLWWLLAAADGSGREHGEVRRAVATALPGLLGLAADEDRDVRRALVWLITACGEASLPLLPLLRARLAEERDADARADLVTALGLLDVPPADGPSAAEVRNRALLAGAPEPAVRRAAATELLRTAPLPLAGPLVEAALDAYEAAPGDDEPHPWPAAYRPLTDRLLDDPDAALRAVARGLPLAWELTTTWRDRERDVLPYLAAEAAEEAAGAGDPAGLCRVAQVAAALPRDGEPDGRAAGAVPGPSRAGVAELGAPQPWLEPFLTSPDPALRIGATLTAVRLRVPGAVALVARLMDELPEETASLRLTPMALPGLVVTAAVAEFGAAAEPVARRVAERPRGAWLAALAPFPWLVASRAEALAALLPEVPAAVAPLLAGCAAAEPALRAHAAAGDPDAAAALARLTGDAGPALALVRAEPDALARRTAAVRVADALGPSAEALLPLVTERLAAPSRESRAAAATALWRITGRTADTAPLVAAPLARPYTPHGVQLASLRTLLAMGVLPTEARDAVRTLARSRRRVVSDGPFAGLPHPDVEARRLARELLTVTGAA
ncbi:hypothetical protein ACF065_04645 [Streptomyces sp. NPDC015232]|uniref:hypothetical protein n=1 Tax=unclassified Streptomyces TaxID=2593676 RepID=UPI003701A5B7